jgi:Flp pilus assembly secretin CpaC/tetratricopeptide (TPR) repeat protein
LLLAAILPAVALSQYLADAERNKLNQYLEKTHKAALERNRILEHIRVADELEKQGELRQAKKHFEQVADSEFLAEAERELIAGRITNLAGQPGAQEKEVTELYKPGVESHPAPELEQPVETVPSLLIEAESVDELPQKVVAAEHLQSTEHLFRPVKLQVNQPAIASKRESPEAVVNQGGYIEVINRKRNILRSHTRAVVNDSVAKAQNYVSQGNFDKAGQAVETAERTVSKNQLYLGDELFSQYSSQLKLLADRISQGQQGKTQQLEQQKQLESEEAQRRYRVQMDVDRKKRMAELMDNARAYQKQQRYEEALGQLESLLAIDPLNDNALILKQTLEDTVNFRKQLEIQRERQRESVAIRIKTDESGIPYADELTFPKNWREINASPFRQPEGPIGQDPADMAVYQQLDEIVDLSELTSEMPFSEAMGVLKNSVDPPLRIVVLWRDLYDNADIDQTTPINMDAISAIPLGAALKLLLESVSGGFADLDYVVENGVITIATVEALPSPLITLVYDVTDLLGRPADYYAQSPEEITADIEMAGAEGFEIEEEIDREELAELAALRSEALVTLIQETVEPDSWYDAGGEGTITVHENKKIIVLQARKVHNEIEKLLKELRKSLGHQVAIEARFLLVGENFLEDVGMDLNFMREGFRTEETIWLEDPEWLEGTGNALFPDDPAFALPGDPCWMAYSPYLTHWLGWDEEYDPDVGGYPIPFTDGDPEFGDDPAWGDDVNAPTILINPLREIFRTPVPETGIEGVQIIEDPTKYRFLQRHRDHTWPEDTEIPGSWGSLLRSAEGFGEFSGLEMGIAGVILDTLQADLLIRATQARRDATTLNAPRVSVLSGESATLRIQKIMWYPTDFEFDIEEIGEQGDILWTLEFEDAAVITGSLLNITPTITPDKKNVLLNIITELRDFLGWEQHRILGPQTTVGRSDWTIVYPTTELSRVETRVSVPDGGTLLLGGHKLTAEIELESGVPVLSKLPIIGRAFSNRSKVKDQRILLILVQPTIILREEAEAGAIAAMQ